MKINALSLLAIVSVAGSLSAEVVVDDKLPAGNVIVLDRSETMVRLRQDQRDTKNTKWFYWGFRVTGAAGKTITFEFPDREPAGGPVGVRGPVVTTDKCRTFAFPLDGKTDKCSFTYTFGADEDETWFYECYPYVLADWQAFVKKHGSELGRTFVVDTLCRSRKGADVPRARFGCIAKAPKYRALVTARHHCSETSASWVLEGIAEAFLAKDELGAWLRENVELLMVPFVDYDGVQAGDQGKQRAPHDHNRDYTEFVYPEVRALTAWAKAQTDGKLDLFVDVHCPWIRGGSNEFVYTPWKSPEIVPSPEGEKFFSETLEKLQCGSMRYKASDDLPFGRDWNTGGNYSQGLSSGIWFAREFKGLLLCRSLEVPFANANGAVVTPESCRDLGRDVAKVWKALLLSKSPQ